MQNSIISLLIVGVALILYILPYIPVWVTTVLAALAMFGFGITDFSGAFGGFGNAATLLIVGMMIMGQAIFTTGLADKAGGIVNRFAKTEKTLVMAILIVGAFMGAFLNGALVVPILMAIVNVVVAKSNGKITRKNTYMPIGFASVLGNNLTCVSASSMVMAGTIIVAQGYKQIGMFEVTLITAPAIILFFIFYYFFGYKLSKKIFDFEEIPLPEGASVSNTGEKAEKPVYPVWKQILVIITFLVVIVAIARGGNFAFWSLGGSCVLIVTGCINSKQAIQAVDWPTYIIASAALGMANGMNVSGGGALVADFIMSICGGIAGSAWGMSVVVFLIALILTQIMSDGACVAIVVPIALAIAVANGWDAVPMALAAASGAKVGLATPISVSCMTMVAPAGYRFKDYFKMGGIQCVIQLVVTSIMLKLVYYM